MQCPACNAENPTEASFCYRCGQALRRADASAGGRRSAYAVQSSENVTQFALISTIMPHTNRQVADNYRWALLVTGAMVVLFTLLGFLPMAILAAAFLVPVTYLIYLYDVNLWEDAPAPVVGGLFVFTGVLSILVSLVFFKWVFADQFQSLSGSVRGGVGIGGISWGGLLIFAVLLPIVAEVAKQIGPLILASRPQFDDMMDGLTFGIAAGTAYAAFETVVAFSAVFTAGEFRTTTGIAGWIPIILNLMIVKSLIYGTATGIATATYSGLGEGYDGLKPKYIANFAFAIAANIAYWLGIRLLSFLPFGSALGVLWGLIVLAVLVVRVRVLLHTALIEGAIEAASKGMRPKAAVTDQAFCPECEMPLLPDAMFCSVCGTSVRATSAMSRRTIRESSPGGAA